MKNDKINNSIKHKGVLNKNLLRFDYVEPHMVGKTTTI